MSISKITERFERTDRAVSPVIGVILMVAITVILAAVIGTFVLDLGQSAGNSAPSASLTVSHSDGGNFTVDHKGGDALVEAQTQVLITDESAGETLSFDGTDDETFGVGNTLTINTTTPGTDNANITSSSGFEIAGDDTFNNAPSSGNQYTVQFIDTESQRVIFETKITA